MGKTSRKQMSPKSVTTIFILISIIFIISGIYVLLTPKFQAKRCTESVNATVVENLVEKSTRTNSKGRHRISVMYRPVFSFTYDGDVYTVESKSASNPPVFEQGEDVELKINPDDPEDFYAPSDKTINFVGTIFAAMGAVFLVVGIVIRGQLRKQVEDIK